jgi:L-arabinose isomerase
MHIKWKSRAQAQMKYYKAKLLRTAMFGREMREMKGKHEVKVAAEIKFRRRVAGHKART